MNTPQKHNQHYYKYLILISLIYVTIDISSNAVAYRFVEIFNYMVTGAAFIFPITYFIGDVIAEVYGYKVARQLIWFDMICNFLFAILTLTVITMPVPLSWHDDEAFKTVYAPLLRMDFASYLAVLAGGFLNAYIIIKLKIITKGRLFWLRSILATLTSEAVVIIIGFFIAFFGTTTNDNILEMMISDYTIKVCFAIIAVFPATILKNFLIKKENINIYDTDTNFNPFKISFENTPKEI